MESHIEALWPNSHMELNSPRARRRFYLSQALKAKLLGELDGQYEHYLKAVEWWDGYPSLKKEEFHRYVSDVANLVNACYAQKKSYHIAQAWINRLTNEEAPGNYHDERFVFLTLSVLNLLHLLNRQDFQLANEKLPGIIDGMNRFGLRRSVVLHANIVVTYFLSKDYEKCSQWVREFTKVLKPNTREDIQRLLRIFEIISLYELGELDELENGIRSLNRYFKKQNILKDAFEYQVLNVHLKKIFNAALNDERKCFQSFSYYLKKTTEVSTAEQPIGLDELSIWVNSYL